MDREAIEVRYDVDDRTRRQMQAYEARRSGQARPSRTRPLRPRTPNFLTSFPIRSKKKRSRRPFPSPQT